MNKRNLQLHDKVRRVNILEGQRASDIISEGNKKNRIIFHEGGDKDTNTQIWTEAVKKLHKHYNALIQEIWDEEA